MQLNSTIYFFLVLTFFGFFIDASAQQNASSTAFFVYSPTSGQVLLVGNATNVSWSNANSISTSYYIDYSVDNAVSFTFVAYFTANTAVANYSWTIPNTPSQQCFVRIRKTNDLTSIGISPMFTINAPPPSITLVNPQGGETYNAGALVNIIWGYYGFNQLDIQFSSDGGNTWSMVVQGQFASASYYTWTVPSIVSNTCKIRIRSTSDTTLTAQCASNFSIIIPSITVNVPNGGQSWLAQSTHTIYWSSTTLSGTNVNIEYSIDSGATWFGVAYGIYNIGSRAWTLPNTPSNKCFIKVSDALNPNTFDVSNATFTIAPLPGTISLFTFINSVFVAVGSNQPIVYSYNNITNVALDYSIDGGLNWISIVSNTPANGNYNWVVPNTVSGNCLVRVSNVANANVHAQSINPFTIFIPSLSLQTPNGAEVLQGASTYNIAWSGIPTQYYVLLQFQASANATWQTIAVAPSSAFNATNSYTWTVPNISSNTCRVRIVDASDSLIYDVSNNVFTINQVTTQIYLLLPYGGQTFATNTMVQIQLAVVAVDSLNIFFSSDNGVSWQLIASNLSSTAGINSIYSSGYYDWITPNVISNNCILKIVDALDTSFYSQNSPTFSLTNPFINIITPNGGETLVGGNSYDIQFYNSGTGNVNLFFSANNGLSWDTIASNQWQGTNGLVANNYNWTVPNINANQCLIKIENLQGQIVDSSNVTFTINSTITSAKNESETNKFVIYPNPAKGQITLLFNDTYNAKTIVVTDMLGNVVLQKKVVTNAETFDTSNFATGIYNVASLPKNGTVQHKKLVVE